MTKAGNVRDCCAHPNVINHAFAHRQRSHMSDFVFLAYLLVNNRLYLSIFELEKSLKNYAEYFSGVFLLGLNVGVFTSGPTIFLASSGRYI